MDEVVLKRGRDRSVRRRHPWLLSGSVARLPESAEAGAVVRVCSAEGEALGYGHLELEGGVRVRLFQFGKEEPSADWLETRIALAVRQRADDPALCTTDAMRLVNAEGDGLPGLVVDRYGDHLVVRVSAVGMSGLAARIAEALGSVASHALWRPDPVAARRGGFRAAPHTLFGTAPGGPVTIREGRRSYAVDLANGQKTGFYLDQREARDRVEAAARDRHVLDLFCYSGGFSVAALCGGAASVVAVDSSAPALQLAEWNTAAVGGEARVELVREDAFAYARRCERSFDLIVVDPPPLARRRADVQRASRAYKDVLHHALRHAAPGADVLFFTCSQAIDASLLRKIAFAASLDAHRSLQVLGRLGLPSDHPVSLDHPEGEYLSGLWLRA